MKRLRKFSFNTELIASINDNCALQVKCADEYEYENEKYRRISRRTPRRHCANRLFKTEAAEVGGKLKMNRADTERIARLHGVTDTLHRNRCGARQL